MVVGRFLAVLVNTSILTQVGWWGCGGGWGVEASGRVGNDRARGRAG